MGKKYSETSYFCPCCNCKAKQVHYVKDKITIGFAVTFDENNSPKVRIPKTSQDVVRAVCVECKTILDTVGYAKDFKL